MMSEPVPAPVEHVHGALCAGGCCAALREVERHADAVIDEHKNRMSRSGKMRRPSGLVKKRPPETPGPAEEKRAC